MSKAEDMRDLALEALGVDVDERYRLVLSEIESCAMRGMVQANLCNMCGSPTKSPLYGALAKRLEEDGFKVYPRESFGNPEHFVLIVRW